MNVINFSIFLNNKIGLYQYFQMTKRKRHFKSGKHARQSRSLSPLSYYSGIFAFLGCLFVLGETVLGAPPKKVTVTSDSTVYGVAYEFGIPTRALIAANNLRPPYVLREGQVLTIPAAGEHIVGAGESLQTIAEDYGIKVDILAQENGITSPFFVNQGDTLVIPSRDTESITEALAPPSAEISTTALAPLPLVKSAPPPSHGSSSLAPLPSTGSVPMASSASIDPKEPAVIPDDLAAELAQEKEMNAPKNMSDASSSKPMIMGNLADKNKIVSMPTPPPPPPVSLPQEDKKEDKKVKNDTIKDPSKEVAKKEATFIWPVEGKIISKFAAGGKNDGINIKVPEGTPVKAAAAGDVMYAGSELKGFGNLLLIKHKDGWMTAYAHNSELLVKKGDKVKQGQDIAKSGKTGDVNLPQVHFEIRKGKQAVDPLPKLGS